MSEPYDKSDYAFINALRGALRLDPIPYSSTQHTEYMRRRRERNVVLISWSADAPPETTKKQQRSIKYAT